MIREAIDNFQISPNLTENIMREISRIQPATPSSSKPLIPWAVAASTLAVVLLMLGFGSQKELARFQQPYNLDAVAEMTVEIIDAPIVANLEFNPDIRTQVGSASAQKKINNPGQQPNDTVATVSEAQPEKTMEDYTRWELPKKAKARLGKGVIRAMQYSPDGKQFAVGSEIGVWLYNAETGKEISLIPGRCESLAISPDGRFLVNGGGDPNSMAGGTRYEVGLQLFEIATGQEVKLQDRLPAASVMWFSKDSKTLVTLNKSGDTISWIDTETGKSKVKKIENRPDLEPLPSAVYALTHDKVAIGEHNGILELWNSKTGKKNTTLIGPEEIIQRHELTREHNYVTALAFSPDGTRLASGSLDNTLRLWDTTNNNEHIIFQQKQSGSPKVLVFSPDGKMLASGEDMNVKLLDTATGKLLTTFIGHIGNISNLAFSPDGNTLTSTSRDGAVRSWNIKTEDPLQSHITGHTSWVKCTSFLTKSSTLASVDISGIITLWDLESSQKTMHRTKTTFENTRDRIESWPLAFSPDGTKLIVKGKQNNPTAPYGASSLIRLKDVSTGRELTTLAYSNENLSNDLTFSPDGKIAAFGVHSQKSGKIRLWNIETDRTHDIQYADQSEWIRALEFSPDGQKLVTGTNEGRIQMWDVKTGELLTSFLENQPMEYQSIMDLTFSSDSSLIAVVNFGRIRLLGSSKQPNFKEVFTDEYWRRAVFSPDNSVLILGLLGGRIQILDVTTGDELTILDGHTASVQTFAFSPDGKILVSAGYDGTILVWDWEEVLRDSSEGSQ